MSTYTEDRLVEQPAIQLVRHELGGWDVMSCFGEWQGAVSDLGREGKREVVLTRRLKAALLSLNPDLPEEAMRDDKLEVIAVKLITKVRQSVAIGWTLRESARAGTSVMVSPILNK